jgi:hypothetical protein
MDGNRPSPEMATYQTARLGPGRHDGPGAIVCIMELAAMLSGERFSDHPVSVCPVIGSLLRAYNDNLDDRRRQDLYRYAAEAVFTRADFPLQRRRAQIAIEWARARYAARGGVLSRTPSTPSPDNGPQEIAWYVMGSLGHRRRLRSRPGWWSDEAHVSLLAMVDEMVALGYEPVPTAETATPAQPLRDALVVDDSLGGELVEQPA